MSYSIRRARPSEAEELTQLARGAKASWGDPAEWLDAWREELTITAEYVLQNRVVVADTGDGLAGVAALERVRGEAVLEHVWVAVSHQRQGIGEALVRHVLALASGAGDRTVRVTSDPRAVGFYERLGGRLAGSVPAPMPGMPERVLPVLELTVQSVAVDVAVRRRNGTVTDADMRDRAVAWLVAAADAQERGDLARIEDGFDELEVLLARGGQLEHATLRIALDFWDGWIDARNHSWMYYEGIGRSDWPQLARGIASDLEADRDVRDERVLARFRR